MAQFFGIETIQDLSKTSQTTIEWASGSNLRIGGQSYSIGSNLVLDLATDIDTGSAVGDTIYYVYAVVVAGVVSLKYSLSSSAPTGYLAYRKIGAFQTDATPEIISTSKKDVGSVGDVMHSRLTEEKFIEQNGAGWVLYDDRNISGSKLATLAGITTLDDARGRFLRALDNGVGLDTGRGLGSTQGHQMQQHNHGGGNHHHTQKATSDFGGPATIFAENNGGPTKVNVDLNTEFSGTIISSEGGISNSSENRPVNLAINVFIKIEDIEL